MKNISVIGAGTMGNGIAHVFAQSGYNVNLIDVSEEALTKARKVIEKNMDRMIAKEKLTSAEKDAALNRLHSVTDLKTGVAEADLVVEAATENTSLKDKIFRETDAAAPAHCILATNTSSISITQIAAVTSRPDKVIGMHFMNPVPVMQLVEIIRGLATTDATYQAVDALAVKLGKTTVLGRDMPGFIVNRVLMPYINEAVYALYEGIGTVEDIDTAMKLGTNVPMGPLTLADFIGLDTCLAIMEVLHEGMGGDSKYRPCPLLRKHVEAGWLGRKVGRGVYLYPS